jgi:hypothetical protein
MTGITLKCLLGNFSSYCCQSRSTVTGHKVTHSLVFTVLMLRRLVLRTPRLSVRVTAMEILHFAYFLHLCCFCEKHIAGHLANCHEGTEVQYRSPLSLTSTTDWSRWSKPHPIRFTPGSDPVPIGLMDGPQGRSGRVGKI